MATDLYKLSAGLVSAIDKFVLKVDQVINDNIKLNFSILPLKSHRIDWLSDKWCRIVDNEDRIYAFVCLQDYSTKTLGVLKAGDIHRPASYRIPARHARGTVFDEKTWDCVGPYGVAYLR